MRAKYYCMLFLSLLLILPMSAETTSKTKKLIIYKTLKEKMVTRTPSTFDVHVEEVNNTLQIVFTGTLPDAEIRLTDKNGDTVINASPTLIYDGMPLYVHTPTGYPYLLEVESPTLELTGEIVLEEY